MHFQDPCCCPVSKEQPTTNGMDFLLKKLDKTLNKIKESVMKQYKLHHQDNTEKFRRAEK